MFEENRGGRVIHPAGATVYLTYIVLPLVLFSITTAWRDWPKFGSILQDVAFVAGIAVVAVGAFELYRRRTRITFGPDGLTYRVWTGTSFEWRPDEIGAVIYLEELKARNGTTAEAVIVLAPDGSRLVKAGGNWSEEDLESLAFGLGRVPDVISHEVSAQQLNLRYPGSMRWREVHPWLWIAVCSLVGIPVLFVLFWVLSVVFP